MNATTLMQEVEASLKQLSKETDAVKQSAFFKQYLDMMQRFWQYSYRNQLLIHHALPEATKVAGFRAWQELGRNVTKGSKAIKILAPFTKKVQDIDPATMQENEQEVTLFFPVSVFDISQTQGQPLPEVSIVVDGDNYHGFLTSLLGFCEERQIKVDFANLGINGLYGYSKGGQIAISNMESVNTQVNTIIHEIAHELLHRDTKLSKKDSEVQAEGTAYVVTKHFGLENKSFNYLALYDANHEVIMANLKAIQEASKALIEHLEEQLAKS